MRAPIARFELTQRVPVAILYIVGPYSSCIGTPLGLKYILYSYMDPLGYATHEHAKVPFKLSEFPSLEGLGFLICLRSMFIPVGIAVHACMKYVCPSKDPRGVGFVNFKGLLLQPVGLRLSSFLQVQQVGVYLKPI